jgi:hypothetical protein
MRWCLVLEEFGPELIYIKCEHSIKADALSRLEIDDERKIFNISKHFGFKNEDLPTSTFPLRYRNIRLTAKTR